MKYQLVFKDSFSRKIYTLGYFTYGEYGDRYEFYNPDKLYSLIKARKILRAHKMIWKNVSFDGPYIAPVIDKRFPHEL